MQTLFVNRTLPKKEAWRRRNLREREEVALQYHFVKFRRRRRHRNRAAPKKVWTLSPDSISSRRYRSISVSLSPPLPASLCLSWPSRARFACVGRTVGLAASLHFTTRVDNFNLLAHNSDGQKKVAISCRCQELFFLCLLYLLDGIRWQLGSVTLQHFFPPKNLKLFINCLRNPHNSNWLSGGNIFLTPSRTGIEL